MIPPQQVLRQFPAHDFSLEGFFSARLPSRIDDTVIEAEGRSLT